MNYNCPVHSSSIKACDSCDSLFSTCFKFFTETLSLQTRLKSAQYHKLMLLSQKSELLKTLSSIKEKLYLKNPMLPTSYNKDAHLLEYIKNLVLPQNILTIVYDADLAMSFLLQKNLMSSSFTCKCGNPCDLKKIGKLFYWHCSCGSNAKCTTGTLWERFDLDPGKIVLLLFLWAMNTTSPNVANLMNIGLVDAGVLCQTLRQIVANHYVETLPKFKGVVEIDESCFKKGSDKNNRVFQDKWVFGLYERERKLVYMEVVQRRNAKTLLPIIQKRCEPGTTIVSDQWPAYERLAELGFPHYTVDHSRFFVNPTSREIHSQNIEISWCWAKHNVKRHQKCGDMQSLLHVFCWQRQLKEISKEAEIANVLNAAIEIISKAKIN